MTKNLKTRDILCFSSSDWHGKWGSRQQVMLRFARRGYRVLFVEQPAGLEHLWRYPNLRQRKIHRWKEGLRSLADNLWIISLPPLLPGRYYSIAINHINQWLTARWTHRYLRELELTPYVLWLYNPEQGSLIGRFGERLSVYHCIDEFTAGTKGRKRRIIAALEAQLLRQVHLVFANSLLTYERKRSINPRTYRIPSGADVKHFAQALADAENVKRQALCCPHECGATLGPLSASTMAQFGHPVAGYVGNVNDKIDVDLLATVASCLADWQFVLVGQTYPQSVDLRPLQRLPNVHFLGRFPFADVPALLQGMDVCLLPYAETELARYRSPLKLYEYLAAGKPVVSTDQPEVREFSAWVEIASTPREYAAAIVHTWEHDSLERRQGRVRMAQMHSWDRRVDEMERHMEAYLGARYAG